MASTIYGSAIAIVPNDSVDLSPRPTGVYVGGAGVVVASFEDGDITFAGVAAGTVLPISPRRVKSTGTTATFLLGLS
jgi:hypothetical protein